MEMKLEIPAYHPDTGIKYHWINGFELDVRYENGEVIIKANQEGLLSLAGHLLNLAQAGIPSGHHLHFDDSNSLEEGSAALIVEKILGF